MSVDDFAEDRIGVCDYLADPPPLASSAADVEQTEPVYRLAFRTAELGPDDLVAGADREDHRTAGRGRSQAGPRTARRQAARG